MNSLIQQLDETLAMNDIAIEQSKQLINRLKKRIEISNEILRRSNIDTKSTTNETLR